MDYTLYSDDSAMSRQTTTPQAAPPVSNTGVQTANAPDCLIDALCFTFGDLVSPDEVKALPEFAGLKWLQMDRGDLGYKVGWYADGICILSEGNGGMGTHVRMMGQACRYLEGRSQFQGWHMFLRRLLRYKLPVQLRDEIPTDVYYSARLTRLDIAMDDTTGLLQMERIERAIQEATIVSTYRKGREYREFDLKTGQNDGQTLNFGKRSGDSMIRFYDRAAKLGVRDETIIRCELELHDVQAMAFAEAIIEGQHLGKLTAGIVRRKLDFKDGQQPDRAGGSQYRAWATAKWWDDFLCGVEKMRLSIAPIVRTLEKGRSWLLRQGAALFATITDLDGGCLDFFSDMMENGRARRPDWQKKLFGAEELSEMLLVSTG